MTSAWRALRARACVCAYSRVFRNFAVFFRWVLLRFARAVTSAQAKNTKQHTASEQTHTSQSNSWVMNRSEVKWCSSFDACNGGAAVSWRIIAEKISLYDRHYSAKWINTRISYSSVNHSKHIMAEVIFMTGKIFDQLVKQAVIH